MLVESGSSKRRMNDLLLRRRDKGNTVLVVATAETHVLIGDLVL